MRKFLIGSITIISISMMLQGCYTSKVSSFESLKPTAHVTKIVTTDSIDVFLTHTKNVTTILYEGGLSVYSSHGLNNADNFLFEIPSEYIRHVVVDTSSGSQSFSFFELFLDIFMSILLW